MFPSAKKKNKKNRLRTSVQIRNVIKYGAKKERNFLIIHTLERKKASADTPLCSHSLPSRLGIVVSKKMIKTAVGRNTFKRVTREYFHRHAHDFKRPHDIVVRVCEPPADTKKTSYHSEIALLFRAGKLL